MRNVFDQYEQIENRVTHALATTLHESGVLLESFCKLLGHPLPKGARPRIAVQHRPGLKQELGEEEAARRSLPDVWIDDGEDWALVIECKIQHSITLGQLRSHAREARDYTRAKVVLISAQAPGESIAAEYLCLRWPAVYQWARGASNEAWARKLAEFLELVERRLIDEEKGLNGALTTFAGIPFTAAEPYSYMEAKRLLRLLMDDLRKRPELHRLVGRDLSKEEGRKSIKGSASFAVWDMLPLAAAGKKFNHAPHLTVGIRSTQAIAQLTIPDAMGAPSRRAILGIDFDEFVDLVDGFVQRVAPVLQQDGGAQPYVEVVQRHWPRGQSGPSVIDAELVFDPRTARAAQGIKEQPQWARAAFDALQQKNSNLQIAIGVQFPYVASRVVATPAFANMVAKVFAATAPLLHRLPNTAR